MGVAWKLNQDLIFKGSNFESIFLLKKFRNKKQANGPFGLRGSRVELAQN